MNAGGVDAFLAKFDGSGAQLWTRQTGTAVDDYGYGVCVDAAGNAYVAGSTDGAMDGNVSGGGTDIFVVKYQGDGTKR